MPRTGTRTWTGSPRTRPALRVGTARGSRTARSAGSWTGTVGRVLRVPGGRRVVDRELARHLVEGLRVGLVIAGCGPAPADPVPIAAHSSSWCGRAPSCRAGATTMSCRSQHPYSCEVVRSTGSPPRDTGAVLTVRTSCPPPSLITVSRTSAGPSASRRRSAWSHPARKWCAGPSYCRTIDEQNGQEPSVRVPVGVRRVRVSRRSGRTGPGKRDIARGCHGGRGRAR